MAFFLFTALPTKLFIMTRQPPRQLPQEIIEIIFSFLSQSTLRCCVRLVCKEWNLICLKYSLWRAGVWTVGLDSKRTTRLLKQLRRLDSLAIWVQCDPGFTDHRRSTFNTDQETQQGWTTFCHGVLDQLDQFQHQRSGIGCGRSDEGMTTLTARRTILNRHPFGNLKELSFHGYGIDLDRYLQPLLPALSHLQKLKLEIWDRQTIKLPRLLRACPVLEDLEIFGDKNEGLRIWVLEDEDEAQRELSKTTATDAATTTAKYEPLIHHSLKRLFLRSISIRPKSIQRLVNTLTHLVAFRIVDFNRPWPQNPLDFACELADFRELHIQITTRLFPKERSHKIEALQVVRYDGYGPYSRYSIRQYFPHLRTLYWNTAMFRDRYWYYGLIHDEILAEITLAGEVNALYPGEDGVVFNPGVFNLLLWNKALKHLHASASVFWASDLARIYEDKSFQEALQVQARAQADQETAVATRAEAIIAEEKWLIASSVTSATLMTTATTTTKTSTSGTKAVSRAGNNNLKVGYKPRRGNIAPQPTSTPLPGLVPIIPVPIRLEHTRAWGCQGLLTLKLGLIPKRKFRPKTAAEATAAEPSLTENEELARAYAYIAAVCPKLRTVELFHPRMEFGQLADDATTGAVSTKAKVNNELDQLHPLKQLASLKDLERLTLRLTTIDGHIEYSDFEWMAEMETKDTNGEAAREPVSNSCCWPRLESFQIRYRNSVKEEDYQYWMALMRELRPGLDVRVKQDLLVPSYTGKW